MPENFDIIRACQLKVGDQFEMFGHEYQVKEIKEGKIFYQVLIRHWTDKYYTDSRPQTMGSMSRQFVTLVKPKPCGDSEKNQSKKKQ